MTQIPLNNITWTQHHTDLIKHELGKNVAMNNEFKKLINKKVTDERIHRRDKPEILYEIIKILKKENHCLKSDIKD